MYRKLMINTGATYTLINKTKLPQIYINNKPIILNTANGQIKAELVMIKKILVQDISLSNFEVILSKFSDENFDSF
ncbi:retroviral-like aspartic protease family protein [Arcobacter sp.]|uniref:retroviral-like aspartic protease family protein n=1 Tax=Arcobacter sp. TaxID=1872629 RepID=UPI003D1223A3